jgi:hypothetical protein
MAEKKIFSLAQVMAHNKENDCWLVITDKETKKDEVYDVSTYMDDHPGGKVSCVIYFCINLPPKCLTCFMQVLKLYVPWTDGSNCTNCLRINANQPEDLSLTLRHTHFECTHTYNRRRDFSGCNERRRRHK